MEAAPEAPSQATENAAAHAAATAAPAATAAATSVPVPPVSDAAEALETAAAAAAAKEDFPKGGRPAVFEYPEAASAGAETAAPEPTSTPTEGGPTGESTGESTAAAEAETTEAVEASKPGTAPAPAGDDEEENLFGSEDEGSHEASLGSDVDLFGDEAPAAAAAAAAGAAAEPEEELDTNVATGGEETAAASGASLLYDDETEDISRTKEMGKDTADSLPPQEMRIPQPWTPNLPPGASILTWKIPPALSLVNATDKKQQQHQQQQQQQTGLAIKFCYDENAAAQGKPAMREPLCSVLASGKRLQVLMRAGLGVDSFFSQSKAAARFEQKMRTAPTATPLVQAAEIAEQYAFLTRQEAARSRRAQAESQRGLTRGFLEAEDSDPEDEQGASLEKIKERFKRRRFL